MARVRRSKVQKAGEPVPVQQVEAFYKDDHPDLIIRDTIFRWLGRRTFTETHRIFQKQYVNGLLKDVETGQESITENFTGVCDVCGTDLYELLEGPHPEAIGNQQVCYVAGVRDLRPTLYCMNCFPYRTNQGNGIPMGEALPGDHWNILGRS